MNIEKFNQWLVLAANIGVLVGIIFLALEVNQNNELMAAQDRFNRYSVSLVPYNNVVENSELRDALAKNESGDELSQQEILQIRMFRSQTLIGWEWSFSEIPAEELPVGRFADSFERAGFYDFWQQVKHDYREDFVAFVDSSVVPLVLK